jgi:PhzF family phenazine biosynthesis protein
VIRTASEGEGASRRLTLSLPPATLRPLAPGDVDELEQVLGHMVVREVLPAIVDVGAIWIVAQLPSEASLLALEPDLARSAALERRLGVTGVSAFARRAGGGLDLEVRSFAPSCGVDEEPVCGSGNGSIAVFQAARGLLPPGGASYIACQGRRVGRDGKIAVAVDQAGRVRVGGACFTCLSGTLEL